MGATPITTPDPRTPDEAAIQYAQRILTRRMARKQLDALVAGIPYSVRPAERRLWELLRP